MTENFKHCVLLFSPDEQQINIVSSVLHDYRVIFCRSEGEAKALCDQHSVCLALLAHDPPTMDAGQLFSDMRRENPGLTGIVLSETIDASLLQTMRDAQLSQVIEVPFTPDQLLKAVENNFARVALQDENSRLRTLLPLYSLGEQFLSSTTEKDVVTSMLKSVSDLTGASNISILLYDEATSCLHIAASKGLDKKLAESIRVQPGESIAGWVFQHRKPVILNRESQEKTIFGRFLRRPDIVSSISCPMIIRDKILGVLNISQTVTDDRFSEADKEMLSVVCTQAALALENVRGLWEMRKTTRMQTLLEQYVAPEVAKLMLARETDPMQLGRIEEVTIFFADIRQFTHLVQLLPLTELRSFLNDFFNIFTEVIFQKQGTVDKFMGDAVLAFFGAPLAIENANNNAVEAALLIRERFQHLKEKWITLNAVFKDLDLGIGITCGKVFLGNVGSSKRFDYTVIGNEVNIAQRLAGESKQCRIYVTEAVKEKVIDGFVFDGGKPVQPRGISNPLKVYTLLVT